MPLGKRGVQQPFSSPGTMLHTSKYSALGSYLSSLYVPDEFSIQGT